MRVLIQRVKNASVSVRHSAPRTIRAGYLALIAVSREDSASDVPYIADKILNIRIFSDEEGRLNRSVLDINGEILAVSQFTLYADCRKGRRPGFEKSAPRSQAEALIDLLVKELGKSGLKIETGFFGEDMEVELINDGPVTVIIEN